VYIAARHNVNLDTMRYLINVGRGNINKRDNVSRVLSVKEVMMATDIPS
jgi:hypothetical protein